MNDSLLELNRILDRWLRWFKFRRSLAWAMHGLAAGLAFALALSLAALPAGRLVREEFLLLAGASAMAGLMLAFAGGFFWPVSRLKTARFFDRRFHLKERLSTALEFALNTTQEPTGQSEEGSAQETTNHGITYDHQPANELCQKQLADTLACAHQVDPRTALPIQPRRLEILLVSVLVLGLLLLWNRSGAYFSAAQQTRLAKQAITEETSRIENLKGRIEQDASLNPQQREQLAAPLEEAIRRMQEAQNLEQAASALSAAEETLNRQASQDGLQAQMQALGDAGRQLSQELGSPLQQFGQDLAQGDLRQAAQDLQGVDPGSLNQEEQEILARQLEELAQNLAGSQPQFAGQLQSAASALRSGQQGSSRAAQQSLQQAADILNETGDRVVQAQQASQTASQIAKGRQQMLQAASTTQNQAGVAQNLQGQGQGQGQTAGQGQSQGSSSQPNAGDSGGGAGRGEGESDSGPGGEAGTTPIGQNNAPGDAGESAYEQIYAPQRLGGSAGQDVSLPSNQGQPGGQLVGEAPVAPNTSSQSQVPYVEVLPAYQEAYYQAIESGRVPIHLRALVKKYFSSLEP